MKALKNPIRPLIQGAEVAIERPQMPLKAANKASQAVLSSIHICPMNSLLPTPLCSLTAPVPAPTGSSD